MTPRFAIHSNDKIFFVYASDPMHAEQSARGAGIVTIDKIVPAGAFSYASNDLVDVPSEYGATLDVDHAVHPGETRRG